jgi:hypothetical protein
MNYKTGKLPLNFIYLGIMLLGISIWRMIVLDWTGIVFFVISFLYLFIKSGLIIDTDNKKLKKYIGFFIIKKGEWVNIKSLINLQIIKTKETQSMNVLSINRTETNDVFKLFMILPDRTIELMSGEKGSIIKKAEKISSSLQTTVINEQII